MIIVKKTKPRYRIQIYDFKEKISRSLSLVDHESVKGVEDIKAKIEDCINKIEEKFLIKK